MKTVGITAVGCRKRLGLHCTEIEQPEVALLMPYREIAVIHLCEHQITPVVGWTGPCHRFTLTNCIIYGVNFCAECTLVGVEGYAAQVIFLLLELQWIILLQTSEIVHRSSVGREHWGILRIEFC